MKNLLYAVALLSLFYGNRIMAATIDCPKLKPLKWNQHLRNKFNNLSSYTIGYVGFPYEVHYPSIPSLFTHSLYTLETDGKLQTKVVKPKIDDSFKHGQYRKFEFLVDDQMVVFQAQLWHEYGKVEKESDGKLAFTKEKDDYIMASEFKFALVHDSTDDDFQIFQQCKKKYAWVEVRPDAWDHSTNREALQTKIENTLKAANIEGKLTLCSPHIA